MTGKMKVWWVKSAIRPDIVRWPAVIFSPVTFYVLDKETKQKIQVHNDLHSFIPMKMSRNEQNKVTN